MEKLRYRIKKYFVQLFKRLLIKDENTKIITRLVYITLSVIAFIMTILNITTSKGALTYATGAFCVLCLIDFACTFAGKKGVLAASTMFAFEIMALFTFFIISGNPDGFSIIWIIMLPSMGMVFYGRKGGSIMCLAMFLILIFFLWIPFGQSLVMFDYGATFSMRFPVLFFAMYVLAFLLETLRVIAYDEVQQMSEMYKEISQRDRLTHLYNRQGLYETIIKNKSYKKINVAIFDIDFFKKVNDTYGHFIGDKVLVDIAKICEENLKAFICRWGGEEFAIVSYDNNVGLEDLDRFRKAVDEHKFVYDTIEIHITISIGSYSTIDHRYLNFDEWAKKADEALYEAKTTGRNKIVEYAKK